MRKRFPARGRSALEKRHPNETRFIQFRAWHRDGMQVEFEGRLDEKHLADLLAIVEKPTGIVPASVHQQSETTGEKP